eukprot:scaffold626_cov409-Prasinococcus_capsulatus_cf.AAC.1
MRARARAGSLSAGAAAARRGPAGRKARSHHVVCRGGARDLLLLLLALAIPSQYMYKSGRAEVHAQERAAVDDGPGACRPLVVLFCRVRSRSVQLWLSDSAPPWHLLSAERCA